MFVCRSQASQLIDSEEHQFSQAISKRIWQLLDCQRHSSNENNRKEPLCHSFLWIATCHGPFPKHPSLNTSWYLGHPSIERYMLDCNRGGASATRHTYMDELKYWAEDDSTQSTPRKLSMHHRVWKPGQHDYFFMKKLSRWLLFHEKVIKMTTFWWKSCQDE